MVQLRDKPYIWATWLPRLLTGERSCEWAIWFKAHHQGWTRQHSDFNHSQWLANHAALLNEQRDLWINRGREVRVEDQNAFRLRGRSATLAGKPDLLVLSKDHVLITDVKSGQERPWCPASTILADLSSISFAGSPPRPQQSRRVAGLRQSGSWGRQTPG